MFAHLIVADAGPAAVSCPPTVNRVLTTPMRSCLLVLLGYDSAIAVSRQMSRAINGYNFERWGSGVRWMVHRHGKPFLAYNGRVYPKVSFETILTPCDAMLRRVKNS